MGAVHSGAAQSRAISPHDLPHNLAQLFSRAAWGRYTKVNDGGDGPTSRLLAGIRSAQHEEFGWNAVITPVLGAQHVRRFGDTVQITVPSVPTYEISRPETITVTIPRLASPSIALHLPSSPAVSVYLLPPVGLLPACIFLSFARSPLALAQRLAAGDDPRR